MSDQDTATLDELVATVQAHHAREAKQSPVLSDVGWTATRSSALRILLQAWKLGLADELFRRDPTGPMP